MIVEKGELVIYKKDLYTVHSDQLMTKNRIRIKNNHVSKRVVHNRVRKLSANELRIVTVYREMLERE